LPAADRICAAYSVRRSSSQQRIVDAVPPALLNVESKVIFPISNDGIGRKSLPPRARRRCRLLDRLGASSVATRGARSRRSLTVAILRGDGARRALGGAEGGLVKRGRWRAGILRWRRWRAGVLRRWGRRAGAKPASLLGPPHDLDIRTKKMDTIKRRWVRPCGQKRRDQQGAAVARVRGFGRGDLDSGTDYYSVPREIDRKTIYIYI
jgi:hypothetical protein